MSTTSLLTPTELRKVFVGLMLTMLLSAMDGTIVSTALPTIAGELGGVEYLAWVVTAYLLTSTITVPLYGKLSDLYGRTILLKAAVGIFTAGSLAIAVSPTMLSLILARALQGVGAGGIIVLAMTIVADVVPPRERGRYQGYTTSVFAFASIAGPLVGGFFVDHLSWRWAFAINLPLSILAIVMIDRNLRLPFQRRQHQLDWLGALLLTGGTVVLLAGTVVVDRAPRDWPIGAVLAAVGVAVLALFVRVERRAPEPLVPISMFADRVVSVSLGTNLLMGIGLFASTVFLPLFLQVSLGLSATASGLLMVPMMLGLLVCSIAGGRAVTKWGRYRPLAIGGTVAMVAGTAVLRLLTADSAPSQAAVAMLLVGCGIGLTMPQLTVALQNAIPVEHMGIGTSMTDFSRKLGGVFGVAVLAALLNAQVQASLAASALTRDLPDPLSLLDSPAAIRDLAGPVRAVVRGAVADGVQLVFTVGLVFAVLALMMAWTLEERPLRETLGNPVEPPGPDSLGG